MCATQFPTEAPNSPDHHLPHPSCASFVAPSVLPLPSCHLQGPTQRDNMWMANRGTTQISSQLTPTDGSFLYFTQPHPHPLPQSPPQALPHPHPHPQLHPQLHSQLHSHVCTHHPYVITYLQPLLLCKCVRVVHFLSVASAFGKETLFSFFHFNLLNL